MLLQVLIVDFKSPLNCLNFANSSITSWHKALKTQFSLLLLEGKPIAELKVMVTMIHKEMHMMQA
jgi:hypothetical protein